MSPTGTYSRIRRPIAARGELELVRHAVKHLQFDAASAATALLDGRQRRRDGPGIANRAGV